MKKIWNKFYKDHGRFYLLTHEDFDKVIKKFSAYKVKKVLDVGCGSGRHSIKLAKENFDVTGIDFSKEALSLAKKWALKENLDTNFLKVNFHKRLPFKDGVFGGILAIDSIHYDTTESMSFSLDEFRRILKKGGILFVTLPTQIGNPLVTHLLFKKEEIEDEIKRNFEILDSFYDKRNFYCVFAIKR